jgi:hypothetical protein
MLGNLPHLEADRARSARVRTRCHAALARSRPSRLLHRRGGPRARRGVLAGLGALYLIETVRQALFFL